MTNEATATTLEGADAIRLAVDGRGDQDQNDLLTEDGAVEFYGSTDGAVGRVRVRTPSTS